MAIIGKVFSNRDEMTIRGMGWDVLIVSSKMMCFIFTQSN